MTGLPVGHLASCTGGVSGDGCSDAMAAGGDVRGIILGVGSGRRNEGYGEESGGRGI